MLLTSRSVQIPLCLISLPQLLQNSKHSQSIRDNWIVISMLFHLELVLDNTSTWAICFNLSTFIQVISWSDCIANSGIIIIIIIIIIQFNAIKMLAHRPQGQPQFDTGTSRNYTNNK